MGVVIGVKLVLLIMVLVMVLVVLVVLVIVYSRKLVDWLCVVVLMLEVDIEEL